VVDEEFERIESNQGEFVCPYRNLRHNADLAEGIQGLINTPRCCSSSYPTCWKGYCKPKADPKNKKNQRAKFAKLIFSQAMINIWNTLSQNVGNNERSIGQLGNDISGIDGGVTRGWKKLADGDKYSFILC
jgi:hypothetical protein